ncbi:tRNA (N(6)-L-threonylcarbamoyladenosine(37)-C(2))-methylthiotransferase [Candidatus Woesearchaeota archaeon]|nr:tRNA (N(6)-L-threonylcarbamoyladenosine(37)-C(2))-methylthiotransferase [Candidatus Woesearchaeota archaeon]
MTKIYIKTYGCSLNQSDSELMAGLLKEARFEITKNIEDAFIVIINTCTVKGPTEKKFFNYLEKIKEKYPYKKIIITGCISQTDPKKLKGYSLLGTSQVTNIVQLVEETIHDNPMLMLTKESYPRLNLPKIRKNPVIEIIPICEGCLGDPCSYCKVKAARGSLRSYPKEDIIKQSKKAAAEGIPEIWLTAQDTGCYGKDIDSSLPELLNELIKLPGNFKIRLGMLNPNHILEFLDKLIEIYKSDKMFKFLHIPVQSGNNDILKEMKRKYTIEQFKEIIEKFKKAIPSITIATDVICGFPGETEQQFYDSLELIKQIRPAVLNISRFWPRPKTPAAKMENQVHGSETKRRSTLMIDIFQNISRMQNERWLNWEGNILIDEKGKEDTWIGRNFAYKPVIVKGNYKLGDIINVKIDKITPFDLRANI